MRTSTTSTSILARLGASVVAALVLFAAPVLAQARGPSSDQAAVAAYRADDLESARTLWLDALQAGADELPDAERARLCYNLGNVAGRREQQLEAVAWYTAALRLRPRDDDTWANLELARLEAGLEAADRGDLAATVERLLASLTDSESAWLALFGLVPLALALGYEALRGGRLGRWLALGALVLALSCALPWLRHRIESQREPVMVLAPDRVQVRSEPRSDAQRIEELSAGQVVARLDQLPGWVEVELDGRRRGWLRDSAVFDLGR